MLLCGDGGQHVGAAEKGDVAGALDVGMNRFWFRMHWTVESTVE